MWTPSAGGEGRAPRVGLWLRLLEVLLTALLIAVTAWSVLAGGP